MFTGIIEAVGQVLAVREGEGVRHLAVRVPAEFTDGLKPGDSVAVDGACLTPVQVEVESATLHFDIIGTTLGRTVAGRYHEGSAVNLERAMVLGGRLDGHLVQGHVDGTGTLLSVEEDGDFWRLRVEVPADVHALTILHGSICLNGISLTVNALPAPGQVEVGIIPHTWTHTNLSKLSPGDPVNVEGDLLGKYVGRVLRTRGQAGGKGNDGANGQSRANGQDKVN